MNNVTAALQKFDDIKQSDQFVASSFLLDTAAKVFSWEYELSQAMYQLVLSGIIEDYPQLKVIVHHAGAMAPFFARRIDQILPPQQAAGFKRFYVDTAILGNPAALRTTELFTSCLGRARRLVSCQPVPRNLWQSRPSWPG